MTSNRIKIAVISSAHGIRGQVKLYAFTENPDDIFDYSPITDATGTREFKLTRHGIKDKQAIASIEGVDDRSAAELLKGTELYAASLYEDDDDTLTVGTLEGMEVRLENGAPYGKVLGLYNFGASDVLEIELLDGGFEMLPFNEGFIADINAEDNYLVIIKPEYFDAPDEELH